MPNNLLKTLTIDGTSNDTLGVGHYLKLDSDNNVAWNAQIVDGTISGTRSLPNNTSENYSCYTSTASGILILTMSVTFNANATGSRYIAPIVLSGGAWTVANTHYTKVAPALTGTTVIGATMIVPNVEPGQEFGMRVAQSSGGALTISARTYRGIFIPRLAS